MIRYKRMTDSSFHFISFHSAHVWTPSEEQCCLSSHNEWDQSQQSDKQQVDGDGRDTIGWDGIGQDISAGRAIHESEERDEGWRAAGSHNRKRSMDHITSKHNIDVLASSAISQTRGMVQIKTTAHQHQHQHQHHTSQPLPLSMGTRQEE